MRKIKDAYYFSHDSNAIIDPKILDMRADYGLEGYGLYWVIIEMLRSQIDYRLEFDKSTYRAIKTLSNTSIDVQQYIYDCIYEFDLLELDGDHFYSQSLLRRMEHWDDAKKNKKARAKKAANARWGNAQAEPDDADADNKNAQAMHEQCTSSADEMQSDAKERKGKEKKGKETKLKETTTEEKKTDLVVADDNNIFYQFQSLGFGNLTEYFKNQLEDLENTYSAAWLIEAMQKSVEQGFYKLSYVKGILQSWKSKGKDAPKPIYKNGKEVKKDFDERPYKKQDFDDLEKKLLGW